MGVMGFYLPLGIYIVLIVKVFICKLNYINFLVGKLNNNYNSLI